MNKLGLLVLGLYIGANAWAEPVCAVRATSLRKGAGAQNPVTWKVPKNMPFLRLANKNGWSKVQDLDGELHWVKSGDVSRQLRCVVVKTNVAALHEKPTQSSPAPEMKTVDRYTPFERVADAREWLQVKDEAGQKAWIHESQVWKPVTVNSFSF